MQSSRQTWTVARPEGGLNIQDFLIRRLAVSRKRVKHLLDSRAVFVNERRVWMAHHRLTHGDRVEVQQAAAIRALTERTFQRQPDKLYEDDDYLIVNKPAGVLSNGPHSLEAQLNQLMPGVPLYAVHRLDRDTSGCLLFARSERARDAMLPLFQRREVQKTYLAIAIGSVPHTLREIRKPIEGLPAVTRVHVVRSRRLASLLELQLETGRTHQARKHLAAVQHPLVGDKVYMTREIGAPELRSAPRQMLHAQQIGFRHPLNNVPVRARAPLPADFKACLAALGLR